MVPQPATCVGQDEVEENSEALLKGNHISLGIGCVFFESPDKLEKG